VDTDPSPPAGAQTPQPIEIEIIRGAVTRLSILAQVLAGATEGEPEHYAEAFAEALQQAMSGDVSPATLSLRDGLLVYAGSEVGGNDMVTRNVLLALQEEGLAALTFLPGVEREELLELSHMLARPRSKEDRSFIDAKAWGLRFQRIHIEGSPLSMVTEVDDQARPVEQVRRLFSQLGVTEEQLGEGISVELMGLLGGLRGLADSPPAARVSAPPAGSTWARGLREIRYGDDVPDSSVGLLAMESLRATTDTATQTELARLWVAQVLRCISDGAPLLAGALHQRLLICVDADYRPHRMKSEVVTEALRALVTKDTRTALRRGLTRHPQTDDWSGFLFTLASSAAADDLAMVAEIGADLPSGPLRAALGDGLAMAIESAKRPPRDLMNDASDDALPVVLQALGRFDDATLVEPLLARVQHAQPTVREAALRALRSHHTPRIGVVASEAMADVSRKVRLEALRYLSVYRIVDAAPTIETRLRGVRESEVDADELRALAIALVHTSRGAAIPALEAIVGDPRAHAHPGVPTAGIAALAAAGSHGKAALDRLGRGHEHLRPLLRARTGTSKPEASA